MSPFPVLKYWNNTYTRRPGGSPLTRVGTRSKPVFVLACGLAIVGICTISCSTRGGGEEKRRHVAVLAEASIVLLENSNATAMSAAIGSWFFAPTRMSEDGLGRLKELDWVESLQLVGEPMTHGLLGHPGGHASTKKPRFGGCRCNRRGNSSFVGPGRASGVDGAMREKCPAGQLPIWRNCAPLEVLVARIDDDVLGRLASFPDLRSLVAFGKITDAGLRRLEGVRNLRGP